MAIKGIVFDMDGVMFDTERQWVEAWPVAGKALGLPIDEALAMRMIGLSTALCRELYSEYMNIADFDRAYGFALAHVRKQIVQDGVPIKPGLFQLLDYLHNMQLPIIVATSTTGESAKRTLGEAYVLERFKAVISGDMFARSKPAPDIYLKACEVLGFEPEECVAIEDSFVGVRSAAAAGLRTIMVPDMMQPTAEIRELTFRVMNDLFEVKALLESGDI